MKKFHSIMFAAIAVFAFLTACCGGNPASAPSCAADRDANYAKAPRFRALIYYSEYVEEAHQDFARQGVDFFKGLTVGDGWRLDVTTDFSYYTYEQLAEYNCVIMLNDCPSSPASREAFEKYMENGGGWVGFHSSGYNDVRSNWPWLNKFLGCGVFKCNNWPPQPALMEIDNNDHPVTKNLPKEFVIPASEFYQFEGDVRNNPDVEVLASLSQKNYPMGLKDVVYGGDWPIVWTNRNYRMVYLNMGHGDVEFTDATQNLLFVNALRWVVSRDPAGNPFDM